MIYVDVTYIKNNEQASIDSSFFSFNGKIPESLEDFKSCLNMVINSEKPSEELAIDIFNSDYSGFSDGTYNISQMATRYIKNNYADFRFNLAGYTSRLPYAGVYVKDILQNIDPPLVLTNTKDCTLEENIKKIYQDENTGLYARKKIGRDDDGDVILSDSEKIPLTKKEQEWLQNALITNMMTNITSNIGPSREKRDCRYEGKDMIVAEEYSLEDVEKCINAIREYCPDGKFKDDLLSSYQNGIDAFRDFLKETAQQIEESDRVFNFRAYPIKDKEKQLQQIEHNKDRVMYSLGISKDAIRVIQAEKDEQVHPKSDTDYWERNWEDRDHQPITITYEDIPRLKKLTALEIELYNSPNWRNDPGKYKCLAILEKMNPTERECLFNSGFQGDDLRSIIRHMVPEVKGQPRFTSDYCDYLHSLAGFRRGVNSPFYPGEWEMEAYKYPALRKELEMNDEYFADNMEHLGAITNADHAVLNAMLEDGIPSKQLSVMSSVISNYSGKKCYDPVKKIEETQFYTEGFSIRGYHIKNGSVLTKEEFEKLDTETKDLLCQIAGEESYYINEQSVILPEVLENGTIKLYECSYDNAVPSEITGIDKYGMAFVVFSSSDENIPMSVLDGESSLVTSSDTCILGYSRVRTKELNSKSVLETDKIPLTNGLVSAMRHNMYLHATDQKEELLDAEIIEAVKQPVPYEKRKNNEVEKMFQDKYHFIPKCAPQIIDMVAQGYMTAADAVNRFDRKRISEFAELSNPAMIRLTYEMDTKALTRRQKEVLECYATPSNIDALIELKSTWERASQQWSNDFFIDFINGADYIVDYKAEINEILRDPKTLSEFIKEKIEYVRAEKDIKAYEQDYEYRFKNNTVEIKGKENVTFLQDDNKNKRCAYILSPNDPRNFTVGYDTYCCQHYNGAGEDCVYVATSDPHAGIWIVEEKGQVVAQAFVWTDEKSDTFVFDNIEFANDRDTEQYADILHEYVKNLPYANVHMGVGYNYNMEKTIENKSIINTSSSQTDPTDLIKGEKVSAPRYEDEGRKEKVYTDYHDDAKVLKRNGEMTFTGNEDKLYITNNSKQKEINDTKEKKLTKKEARAMFGDGSGQTDMLMQNISSRN